MAMNSGDLKLRPEDETQPRPSVIHIAAACDDAYAMPLAVMLRSLIDNLGAGRSVIAHIMFQTLSPETMGRLHESVPTERLHIQWTPVGDAGLASATAPIRAYDHVSPASYFRLLLPDLLPAELDRVIYVDCDLVVLADVATLWHFDLDDDFAGAVSELTADSRLVSSPQGLRLWRELGLSAELEQFNSGVLLINLVKWRAELVKQRALAYLAQAADWLRWHDQEALNAVFAGKWLRLDDHWNLTMRHLVNTFHGTCKPPCIIHYHTAVKPWHADYSLAFQDLFFDYLDRTAWSGWRPARTRFASIRRFGRHVVKALRKRQHALRRLWREYGIRRRGVRLLASRPELLGNPIPENVSAGEVRIFMVADDCSCRARTLIGYYLGRGGDRVILAVDASAVEAWRSFANSNARVHLTVKGDRSADEMLRVLLHQYGQGHWCLLARSDEWLRFPCDDRLTLTALTRLLDAQHCTALISRRVEVLNATSTEAAESSAEDLMRCGGFRLRSGAVRKLPMPERDTIRNRIFVADSFVVPCELGCTPDSAYRSVVSLLRYAPDMLIGPGARSAHGTRTSDIEGVTLQVPAREYTSDLWQTDAPARIGWRELEAAGLLRVPESMECIARDAPRNDVWPEANQTNRP